jgi:hypothetical protein
MKNLYGWFFSGIASQWDAELEEKKTSYQSPILKMVMGSEIGLLGRKKKKSVRNGRACVTLRHLLALK